MNASGACAAAFIQLLELLINEPDERRLLQYHYPLSEATKSGGAYSNVCKAMWKLKHLGSAYSIRAAIQEAQRVGVSEIK